MKRKINFDRDGLTLVGNLFTPKDFDEKRRYNAAIDYCDSKPQVDNAVANVSRFFRAHLTQGLAA